MSGKAIERRRKAGYGQGEGANYKPYLRVCDVPSCGTGGVINSIKDGHDAHSLSQGEVKSFLCYEWSDQVIAIREQYPLDLEDMRRIAASLGFKHPKDTGGGDIVMTTDFMLSVKRGDEDAVPVARTFKYVVDLCGARVFEKLEIERVYYEERGIDWGIVTDADLPPALVQIADWTHDCRDIGTLSPLSLEEVKRATQYLSSKVSKSPTVVLAHICSKADLDLALPESSSLKVVRFLVANKFWEIDVSLPLDTSQPMSIRPKHFELAGA